MKPLELRRREYHCRYMCIVRRLYVCYYAAVGKSAVASVLFYIIHFQYAVAQTYKSIQIHTHTRALHTPRMSHSHAHIFEYREFCVDFQFPAYFTILVGLFFHILFRYTPFLICLCKSSPLSNGDLIRTTFNYDRSACLRPLHSFIGYYQMSRVIKLLSIINQIPTASECVSS